MTRYACPKCAYIEAKEMLCPKCKVALETACPVCSKAIDYCTCVKPSKVRPR
ncbi:hypothetical protein HY488_02895 [Candidatus Woesearchaeota archaeon]|nr:hypothetical protein [Candidatus Woesearchaeota archaeon]